MNLRANTNNLTANEQIRTDYEEMVASCDTGIASVVHFLNEFGVETFESCEGGEGHAYPYPTVRFHGDVGMGFRAFGLLRDRAIPMFHLARLWQVIDGEPVGPYWEITFTRKVESLDGYFVGSERVPAR